MRRSFKHTPFLNLIARSWKYPPKPASPCFFFLRAWECMFSPRSCCLRPDRFQTFLDDFIQSLRMHSGVRAVASESWHLLLQSPLKSWLEHEGRMLDQSASGDECLELLAHVDTMLDPTISSIYRRAIEDLQKAYNASRSPSSNFSRIGPIISWPVTISSDYINLLTGRQPRSSCYFVILRSTPTHAQ